MKYPALLLASVCALAAPSVATAAQSQPLPVVTVRVMEGGEAAAKAADVRRVVVGPGVNAPDPFPGFGGSVAWAGLARSKRGTLLVAFNAGYWHVSPPTPYVMPEAKVDVTKRRGVTARKTQRPTACYRSVCGCAPITPESISCNPSLNTSGAEHTRNRALINIDLFDAAGNVRRRLR